MTQSTNNDQGNRMIPVNTSESTVELSGLDGSNPLAYLAALGTLRTLTAMLPDSKVTMRWETRAGTWHPVVTANGDLSWEEHSLSDAIAQWLQKPKQFTLFEQIGDNLTLSPKQYRSLAQSKLLQVSSAMRGDLNANTEASSTPIDRTELDFLAAFGSDATYQPHSKDRTLIQDTALRTMSGAGHQHFIKFMREIILQTTSEHILTTLFRDWSYEDDGRGLNLRWDPIDDRRYAMRWKNPSADPATTMRGANRLAIEALPLFPVGAKNNDLNTTAFVTLPRQGTFFQYPIWLPAIEQQTVQTILQHPALTDGSPLKSLGPLGIATVFRSQRITVGKFRNFTPSKSVV